MREIRASPRRVVWACGEVGNVGAGTSARFGRHAEQFPIWNLVRADTSDEWVYDQLTAAPALLSPTAGFCKTSTAGMSVSLAFSTASASFGDTWYVQAAPGGGMTLILNDDVHWGSKNYSATA